MEKNVPFNAVGGGLKSFLPSQFVRLGTEPYKHEGEEYVRILLYLDEAKNNGTESKGKKKGKYQKIVVYKEEISASFGRMKAIESVYRRENLGLQITAFSAKALG